MVSKTDHSLCCVVIEKTFFEVMRETKSHMILKIQKTNY
jgi:hypothetical protein